MIQKNNNNNNDEVFMLNGSSYSNLIDTEKRNIIIPNLENETNCFEIISFLQSIYEYDKMLKSQYIQPLNVNICSFGGLGRLGLEIYDLLKQQFCLVRTVLSSDACSIASVIFLAGDVRISKPHSRFMVHRSAFNGLDGNSNILTKAINNLKELDNYLVKIYNDNSIDEYDEAYWREKIDQETDFTGKTIFDMGISNVYKDGASCLMKYKASKRSKKSKDVECTWEDVLTKLNEK